MATETHERTYPLTYEITPRPERVPASWVREQGLAACDAVVVLSMIYPEDGSFSLAVPSLDGRTGEPVTDADLWKVWTMLAKNLSESPTLSAPKREFCELTFKAVFAAMAAAAAKET